MGRPTKFKPEMIGKIKVLIEHGFTEQEIADQLDISRESLDTYKNSNKLLFDTIKSAKDIADDAVETSLWKRASGMRLKKQVLSKSGEIVEVEEEIPPDATSMIFWLKNRRRDQWRDRHDVAVEGSADIVEALNEARSRLKK